MIDRAEILAIATELSLSHDVVEQQPLTRPPSRDYAPPDR